MKQIIATLIILLIKTFLGSSFVPSAYVSKSSGRNDFTSLFGSPIQFVGDANARLSLPPVNIEVQGGETRSLSDFLSSSASDPVLLGAKENSKGEAISQCRKLDDDGSSDGVVWECQQASVQWFGMQLTPVFVNRIQKNPSDGNVVISIIDAQTRIDSGGRLGNTLASAMKRSQFEGRNVIGWREETGAENSNTESQSYVLEGNLKLTLTIRLPSFLPVPPGFNKIGSKIVERTCRERLKQNLSDISNAYLIFLEQQQVATGLQ